MQFIASTWASYGVDADGDGPPTAGIRRTRSTRPPTTCARRARPATIGRAIFAYNHAELVRRRGRALGREIQRPGRRARLRRAPGDAARERSRENRRAAGAQSKAPTCACRVRAQRRCASSPANSAELDPDDGHLALVPAGVPATVQAMVVAGNELQDLPYGPGGHPDPLGAARGGLLEHRQLRALPRRRASARGNPQREPVGPGLRRLGRARPGTVGDDLCDREPDTARVHR